MSLCNMIVPKPNNEFNPYALNGGSIVAVAGKDFAVIGSDTRLNVEYSIYTRNQTKLTKLSDACVLGIAGCWCDAVTLTKIVKARMDMYKYENNKTMSTPALAQMLSTILYYKRFFPYYVASIIAGLDENGEGCVFNFDPMGHCEMNLFNASGTASAVMQPFLDNQVGSQNMNITKHKVLTQKRAMSILKDAFTCATERHIYIGDKVHIITVTKDSMKEETFSLRKD